MGVYPSGSTKQTMIINGGFIVFFVLLISSPYSNAQCNNDQCSFKRVFILDCICCDNEILKIVSTSSYSTVDFRLLSNEVVWLKQANLEEEMSYYCKNNDKNVFPSVSVFELIKDVMLEFEADVIIEITLLLLSNTPTGTNKDQLVQQLIQDIIELCDPRRHVFHVFVDPRANIASHFTTSADTSAHQVTYSDNSHFNKALTLHNLLINEDTANNIQAHLLSIGVHITVNHHHDLESFRYPSFREVFGYRYKNLCDSSKCPSETFCSPLHGCIEPASSRLSIGRKPKEIKLINEQFTVEHSTSQQQVQSSEDVINDVDLSIIADNVHNPAHVSLRPNGVVEVWNWTTDKPFIKQVTQRAKPVLLKHSVVDSWSAINDHWTIDSVCSKLHTDTLDNVKCSDMFLTFDPDHRAPLKLNLSIPYDIKNVSKSYFCSCVEKNLYNGSECDYNGYYYFSSVPNELKDDLKPNDFLFKESRDKEKEKQFIWISSEGMITHGHFDQDYNIFVQIEGKKRFTLWPSWEHELMYMYPRVHPLWHKSRINFRNPDLVNFPNFALARGQQVIVEPGDVLYVPPYTWHYVETLSPSISLSTWSHDYHMYHHMDAIYGYDHKFDLMLNNSGQMFALRMYLDLLVQDLYGYKETSNYFSKLLHNRFNNLEYLFPPNPLDSDICDPLIIPTAEHVYGFVKLDVAVIAPHFKALPIEVMDILLADYVEEISAQVVGIDQLLAFFRYCFQDQDYRLTDMNQSEHSLWD